MLLPLNSAAIKYSAIALAITAIVGVAYRTAYNHGNLSGRDSCIEETEHLVQQIHARISQVEKTLDKVADMATIQQEKLSKDIDEILKRIKSQPVVVVKNGKCTPSTNFLNGINEAIRRANEK